MSDPCAGEADKRAACRRRLNRRQVSDYQISQPNGASVLSIEDHGVMELQLFLKRS